MSVCKCSLPVGCKFMVCSSCLINFGKNSSVLWQICRNLQQFLSNVFTQRLKLKVPGRNAHFGGCTPYSVLNLSILCLVIDKKSCAIKDTGDSRLITVFRDFLLLRCSSRGISKTQPPEFVIQSRLPKPQTRRHDNYALMLRLFTINPDNQAITSSSGIIFPDIAGLQVFYSPPHSHVVTINASINRNTSAPFASLTAPSPHHHKLLSRAASSQQDTQNIYASLHSLSIASTPPRSLAESLTSSFSIQNIPR